MTTDDATAAIESCAEDAEAKRVELAERAQALADELAVIVPVQPDDHAKCYEWNGKFYPNDGTLSDERASQGHRHVESGAGKAN